jgi:hypothetical protein
MLHIAVLRSPGEAAFQIGRTFIVLSRLASPSSQQAIKGIGAKPGAPVKKLTIQNGEIFSGGSHVV